MSKFLTLLQSGEEIDCNLIIGNVDMPASFVWDENNNITAYGMEKYKELLEAEYAKLENGNIEIYCGDEKLGEHFCLAAAGYIGLVEFTRIFGGQ